MVSIYFGYGWSGSAEGCVRMELASQTARKRAIVAATIRAEQSQPVRDAVSMFSSGSRQQLCLGGIAVARRREADLRSGSAACGIGGSLDRRLRQAIPALLVGGLSLTALPVAAAADPAADDLNQLRATIQKEIAALKKQEQKLHQQVQELDRKSQLLDQKNQLLDQQLATLRATGLGSAAAAPAASASAASASAASASAASAPSVEVAQTPTPATSAPATAPAGGGGGTAAPSSPGGGGGGGGESAPIAGPSAAQQQARQVVETAPSLSSAGGVLTPKGVFIIDPSIEYDYWSQNQLGVNGFQIIPGITFGNIFANRVEQNITTAAVTGRYGVTDQWEINAKIPYIYNTGSTTSLIPVGTTAQLLTNNATGTGIGDIQLGSS
jgi:hypothetical protein